VLETAMYFQAVFQEDLSLREFLESDWTVLNPRLAMHYGMPPLKETNFRKVKLTAEHQRGGLLTQASILSLTSDGTRHRPVHRGVWVSEAIFGRTPPPPPPNVEPLEPTPSNKPKATIRQQLEAHATHATCAACHQKIDPLGFAFNNFDAVGRWRPLDEGKPVDAAGGLPDGGECDGVAGLEKGLLRRPELFARTLTEKLFVFALGRAPDEADAPAIRPQGPAGGNGWEEAG